jgi:hypothetical protein
MATYSINFFNNSSRQGNICVFQKDPGALTPDVFALAWLTEFSNPNTGVLFTWNLDYSFIWNETGALAPGITVNASEVLPAGLTGNNTVTLTKKDGAYEFADQRTGAQPGSLTINSDATVAVNQATVGVGMSGAGTFVVQAAPDTTYVFTPHPEYWVAFGDFRQGQALLISRMNNTAQVAFPPDIYAMDVTLNADNTWTVAQGS